MCNNSLFFCPLKAFVGYASTPTMIMRCGSVLYLSLGKLKNVHRISGSGPHSYGRLVISWCAVDVDVTSVYHNAFRAWCHAITEFWHFVSYASPRRILTTISVYSLLHNCHHRSQEKASRVHSAIWWAAQTEHSESERCTFVGQRGREEESKRFEEMFAIRTLAICIRRKRLCGIGITQVLQLAAGEQSCWQLGEDTSSTHVR